MFCPNCGKDCGSAKFCPECGEKLQQVAKKDAVWQVGMPCPNCGGTKLDGSNCLFCGAQLIVEVASEESKEEDSYEIPYRYYHASPRGISLAKDFIVIHRKQLFRKEEVFNVPFDQLVEVKYKRELNKFGNLCFRWKHNGGNEYAQVVFDPEDTSSSRASERFFHLFAVIKYLAPESTKFTLDIPASNRPDIDFDDYFRRFAPYRKRAAEALNAELALGKNAALEMIHTEFEIRQMKMYEEEPRLAIRDMNHVIAEWGRLCDEDDKKREERALARAKRR